MLQQLPQFHPLAFYRQPTMPAVGPTRVSETEYWEKYYNDSDHHYEWNNGYLEEKGVSEKLTTESYEWFFELLRNYLRVTGNGQMIALETGFRLVLPGQRTIRKPDLGVILQQNPVPWQEGDHSYQGICDLCVEALSDSTTAEIERDTETKFTEYARAGVKEYYILYAYGDPQEFYQWTPPGVYIPIPRRDRDLICSRVLPGFQFRVSDLQRQPSPEEMSEDYVYKGFMLPALQASKQAQQQVTQLLEMEREARLQEQEARHVAEVHAQQEREARRREEEARQVAEALAQQEQEARRQEQEARQVAEVLAQQEQEARRREEEARQMAEVLAQQEREARQVAEVHARQEREARLQEREARLQEQEARQAIEAKFRQLEVELARFRLLPESASS
jgi:hypothetical protein